jgi:hypothetical protein
MHNVLSVDASIHLLPEKISNATIIKITCIFYELENQVQELED